ncbi:MAG: DJ-1 family glyoxalase III [Erysipelotrichaceae bacterium]
METKKRIAVLVAAGFEEMETVTIVDILRRGNMVCDLVSIEGIDVGGAHNIKVKTDLLFDQDHMDYDMVVLPGGLAGAMKLAAHPGVIALLKDRNEKLEWIGAICAGLRVADTAGLLDQRNYTAYPGYENRANAKGNFVGDLVVVDDHLVTSRGPATVYEFAFAILDLLGGDSAPIKDRMLYPNAFIRNGGNDHA